MPNTACQTHPECIGIPPQAWSVENLRNTHEMWGLVMYLGKRTKKRESLSSTIILIETSCLPCIQEWIHLQVGDKGYDVYLREIGREVVQSGNSGPNKEK